MKENDIITCILTSAIIKDFLSIRIEYSLDCDFAGNDKTPRIRCSREQLTITDNYKYIAGYTLQPTFL